MKNHLVSILASIGLTILVSFFIDPVYSFSVYIWSYISLAFVLSVAFRVIFLRQREDILFVTIIFLTWLNFLEPYLKDEKVTHLYRIIPDAYLFDMSFFSALGVIALYIGYYASFSNKQINPIFSTKNKFKSKLLGQIMLGVMVLFIVYKTMLIVSPTFIEPFKGLLAIIDYSPSLISAGLTLIILRKKGNLITIITLILFLAIQLFIAFAQTLFIYVILITFVPFLMYFFERKKVPVISLIAVIIVLTPLFLLRHYFRRDVFEWWSGKKTVTTAFLINRGVNIISETYSRDNIFDTSDLVKDADKNAEERFEQVSYLGQCVYQHKVKNRPYLWGETFWWLPIAPIPRAILPFKPENNMGTTLAEDYGLKGHTGGAMNWPMLVEYFINFGFYGIIFFSFFQGMAYKYTYKLLAFGHGDLNLIALFSLILPIIKIESNVTLIFGQIIQFLLIWYVLSVTLLKKYKYKRNKT